MERYYLLVLSLLFHNILFSQDYAHTYDSLQNIIGKHLQESNPNFEDVIDVYDSIAYLSNDSFRIGKALNFRGLHQYFDGNNIKAAEHYRQALIFFDAVNDTFYIALANNNIGAAYDGRNDPALSIAYYERAYDKFRIIPDTFWMANVMNNIAIQFTQQKLYKKGIQSFGEAIKLYNALKDTFSFSTAISNMSANYELLGDINSADSLLNLYFNIPQQYLDYESQSNVLNTKAKILLSQGLYVRAQHLNSQAIDILVNNDLKRGLEIKIKTKSDILKAKGDFAGAFEALTAFYNMQDSIWDKTKDATTLELMTQYEVEKKEKQILTLNTEKEIQQLKLDKANQSRLLYGFGFIALIGLSSILFYLIRLRNRNNRKLTEKNDIIRISLEEKDILLREIHHRVKNNLQVISSLLNLQSQYIKDEEALKAITEGQNRVGSMALIHQNLYKENNLSGVESGLYFSALIDSLFESYNIRSDQITLTTEIENINLDVDTMVPLGLMANELITNSLKHAFTYQEKGQLFVGLIIKDNKIVLTVKDDGKGVKSEDFLNSHSFGNKIISTFRQKLGAELFIDNTNGTEIILIVSKYRLAA